MEGKPYILFYVDIISKVMNNSNRHLNLKINRDFNPHSYILRIIVEFLNKWSDKNLIQNV